jgi:hypothetical protein
VVPTLPTTATVAGTNSRRRLGVIFALMSSTKYRWTAIAALTGAAVTWQLTPASAWADLHNITYIARIDGLAPGSQATFVTNNNQTNSAPLSAMPGNAFEANTVLDDPNRAGMQVSIKWPYSAKVHCEIDVDDNVATQIDQFVKPAAGNNDPMNGVLTCGAPVTAGATAGLPSPTDSVGPTPRPTVGNPQPRLLGANILRDPAIRR